MTIANHSTRIGAAIALFAMSSTLAACAVVWGFEDPLDPAASPALVGDGSIAEGRAPGCENEKADETAGVFVVGGDSAADAGTAEDPLCGAKDTPCVHIATGLARARDLGRTLVYVVRGTYTESISMPPGVTLQGGWNALRTGATITYARACAEPPGSTVTIQAPEDKATAVLVDDTAQPVTLNDLTIKSKTKPLASESVYGLRARGDKNVPQVTLTDVFVVAAAAGNGDPAKSATLGDAGAGACQPPWAGADGGEAGAPPAGDAGSQGAPPSSSKFGPDGLAASNGADGAPGVRGDNGASPVAPTPLSCFASCTPPTILGACTGNPGTPASGKPGDSGCGGAGGGGGHGGGGGGSSVAVYAWNAIITTTRGALTAGNGGAGAVGSAGGAGGAGAQGANGSDSASCTTGCGSGTVATGCSGLTSGKSTGTAGTKGALGGAGGAGSPGAGGDSFAIALGGTGKAQLDPLTLLATGVPGSAPTGGVPGKAAAKGAP